MIPTPTDRLRFREMADDDLDVMAGLLGDPEVMRFYPRPKTRAEAQDWIDWNQSNYAEHGYGLWIVETTEGAFVGGCGLTWQVVDDEPHLEVGYQLMPAMQGHGYAREAARACVDLALGPIGATYVVAIIRPQNQPSRRLAERIGMAWHGEGAAHGLPVVVYSTPRPDSRPARRSASRSAPSTHAP